MSLPILPEAPRLPLPYRVEFSQAARRLSERAGPPCPHPVEVNTSSATTPAHPLWQSPIGKDLHAALTKHLPAHHTIAQSSIESLARRSLEGFTIASGFKLSEEGSTAWNEIAVLTERTLILVNLEELSRSAREKMPTEDSALEVTLRTIPLRSVTQVQIQQALSLEGTPQAVMGLVFLSTLDDAFARHAEVHSHDEDDSDEGSEDAGLHNKYQYDMLHFTATLEDEVSAAEVERCRDFLGALAHLAA